MFHLYPEQFTLFSNSVFIISQILCLWLCLSLDISFLSICSSSPTTHPRYPSRCRPLAVEMVSDPMPPPTTQMKQVGLFFAMVIHGKMESWKSHLVKVRMVWTNCNWWINSCTWDHFVLKSMINRDAINLSSNIKWCKIARVFHTQ